MVVEIFDDGDVAVRIAEDGNLLVAQHQFAADRVRLLRARNGGARRGEEQSERGGKILPAIHVVTLSFVSVRKRQVVTSFLSASITKDSPTRATTNAKM